jgi:hypothetical protein
MIKKLTFALAICALFGAWTCSNQSQAKALKASHDFASTMNAAQQTVVTFHSPCLAVNTPAGCGTITDAEDKLLQEDFILISECGPKVNAAIVANSKQGVKDALNGCSLDLNKAINEGAAGIKNPESKAAITTLLVTAESVLNGVLSF